ncbi:hypothetical protein [Deinococcus cellulosilyticus]|uniref:Uncharacterized protein n=1 Tax=Deinococcus cellulosilyticus (strain DSM 18568 / NBRC 106333 / KACC 11606 / 5516J-15) TaxID=1223518 RepID=A0A511N193_DEIC1|nr:hypothetical protein [Deinococcus cellulosilyticus]GEM46247.1 hypothetical protein DC3_18820 [Deinococcus cellulosilyticus NBRC 106333 = KACC 11606]
MSESHYVPVFSKFTFREMLDHAPNPLIGVMGFILSRFGMINASEGNPAPNPVAEDLASFEDIPEEFQQGVQSLSSKFEKMGFELLSFMYNPLYPSVAGAYLLHQNRQWIAFVAYARAPQLQPGSKLSHREVYSLLGFAQDKQCYSVTTAPFMQVPHVSRIFLRNTSATQVLRTFEKHVQGKVLQSFQGLSEVQEAMDEMSQRSHRYLVTRGVKKAVPAPVDPEPESKEEQEDRT